MASRWSYYFFVLIFLVCAPVPAAAQAGAEMFRLDTVSHLFPSEAFQDKVTFWRDVFATYEMNQVIFHDADDVRLVYSIEQIGDSPEMTPEQAEAQIKRIRKRRDQFKSIFNGIISRGADSPSLSPLQQKIVSVLGAHGYETSAGELRKRRDSLRSQRGIRSKFLGGLIRSGRYLDYIEDRLQAMGLPTELSVLPHVESSFDYNAYSKAGAAGIWQFTRSTGRSYLRINSLVDERLDPLEATEAAARVLKDNYTALGSWPLALTAYNYGKYGMLRAQKRYGSDLTRIIENHRTRTFGFASKNFYAEFLAALEISRNARHYFGDFTMEPPLEFETVRLRRAVDPVHLTADGRLSVDQLADLNPHLRTLRGSRTRPVPAGVRVRVPEGLGQALQDAVASAPASTAGLTTAADGSLYYRVERGDSLGRLATRFGTSVTRLKSLNGLRNGNLIYPGQKLLVSRESGQPSRLASRAATPTRATYEVRRGDTLSSIASRFRTSPGALQQANGIRDADRLEIGQRLVVPGGSSTSYRIRRGDTLTKIARRFKTSVDDLKEANSIRNANRIQPGQHLIIPLGDSQR